MKVPCVKGIPVLLPGHQDLELCGVENSEKFHYHIDTRFMDPVPKGLEVMIGDVEYEEMRLVREKHFTSFDNSLFIYIRLWNMFQGVKMVNGICPHKGTKVTSEGVCPAHGLHWNKDGFLRLKKLIVKIPRTKNKAPAAWPSFTIPIVEACLVRKVVLIGTNVSLLFNDAFDCKIGDKFKVTSENIGNNKC